MPEHLRALVYLLLLGTVVWAVAGHQPLRLPIDAADFARRRNVWFAATLFAYLAHNFWVFLALLGIVMVIAARRERNPMALYLVVILSIPPFWSEIPGVLGIDHIMALDVPRLLALVLLMPLWFVMRAQPQVERFGTLWPDRLLAAYLVLFFAAQLPYDSITNSFRVGIVYPFLEIFLPYYVASRTIRSYRALKDLVATFAVVGMVLSAVAAFESARSWLLYARLDDALGVPWLMGSYLMRGDGGQLRVQASLGHSLVLGYTMMIAFVLFMLLRPQGGRGKPAAVAGRAAAQGLPEVMSRLVWLAGAGVLLVGLLAPLSRGPWVGTVAGLVVLAVSGPRKLSRLLRVFLLGAAAVAFLFITPVGQNIVQYLPFVGSVDTYNVTYRQRLFDVSIEVILQRPIFGAYDFMLNPLLEQMRQGEGIIDVVNSYLGVALRNGLVGLALFLGIFGTVLWGIAASLRAIDDPTRDSFLAGRVLLATLVAVMVMIATTSSILTVHMVYFTLLGVGVGYRQMVLGQVTAPGPVPVGQFATRR